MQSISPPWVLMAVTLRCVESLVKLGLLSKNPASETFADRQLWLTKIQAVVFLWLSRPVRHILGTLITPIIYANVQSCQLDSLTSLTVWQSCGITWLQMSVSFRIQGLETWMKHVKHVYAMSCSCTFLIFGLATVANFWVALLMENTPANKTAGCV